ncbi:MAG: polyprenyl synthetase family protein [Phycisphaerales bacterium]|nr:polyprenyl synthetase family protein [Phycisphaerales bacterium]
MDYSLRAGGKRLRPALVLECFNACGGSAVGSYPSALAAAGAMELIHTFSLVHDDLPAMDDDDLRRGRPTNHKVFGEAMAILAGDAMTTLAFELIAVDAEARLVGPMVAELARQTGPVGMIGGQVLDMDSENQALALPDLQRIHRMKTGALLMASCRLGALAGGADQNKVQAMGDFGRYLGLAFQIVDDLLDVISTAEQMGKATGKDADRGKNTYPILLGLEPARLQAQQQLATALKILDSFGSPADGLRSLAKFVVERSN